MWLNQRSPAGGANRFDTTRWSVVLLSAQSQAPGCEEAFAELCRLYWYPLYGLIRHRGYSPENAQDLVSVGSVKTLIHRLRKQYTALVREEIGRTVSDSGDVDAEMHELVRSFDCCGRTDHALNADPVDPGKQPSKEGGLARREIRTCATCGTKFSVTSDSGICPVCILLGSFGEESGSADSIMAESGTEVGSAETEHLSIVRRFEHYEVMLDEDGKPIELGRGAMGITYKAFDVDLRIPVTLKLISEKYVGDESARLRFLREARAAAKVRHSNVASVFHLGRSSQGYFYAMEFVEGETLESLIKRSGRLEVKLTLEILSQVAAGLAAVHKQKLVHRDMKPSNIMVSFEEGGIVIAKIIDLGLAKSVDEADCSNRDFNAWGLCGTPEFASPEQFAGVPVDIRSDLYSLGVALWEMLTGRVPFRGSAAEVMYQHLHAPYPLNDSKEIPRPVDCPTRETAGERSDRALSDSERALVRDPNGYGPLR